MYLIFEQIRVALDRALCALKDDKYVSDDERHRLREMMNEVVTMGQMRDHRRTEDIVAERKQRNA